MHSSGRLAVYCLIALAAGCGDDNVSAGSSTVSIGGAAAASGESGEITVTVQRTGGSRGAISVPFTTLDDSAVQTSDYIAATGTVEWEDGDDTDKTIVVTLVDDVVIESLEMVVVELGEPSNDAKLGTASVTAMIVDDDHPGDSYAVTSAGRLVHFDKIEPGRLTWSVDLSGLGTETILGIDIRPADGLLYALTDAAKLYTIDPMTGVATLKSTLVADSGDSSNPYTGLAGTDLGIDFNPVVDRLRVTSASGQNLRINVDSGAVITDTAINGLSAGYGTVAYNNNIAPACRTTLYAIDVGSNRFLSQTPPNDGLAVGVGGLGLDATASGGFDVVTDAAGVSSGLAVLTVDGLAGFYGIDLASGAATVLRATVGPLPTGESVTSFAVSTVPATAAVTQNAGELYGVTATEVLSFNRAAPEKLCGAKPITGLAAGENVVALDMRPSTGVLYILTNTTAGVGRLHRLDPVSGMVSPPINISVALTGTVFGMDFEPTGGVPLRIVSDSGQNITVTNLTTGTAMSHTPLSGGTAAGIAYTDSVPGAGTTKLYAIDPAADRLLIQTPPDSGTLVDVGSLGVGVDITDVAGFDIDGRDNAGIVVVTAGQSSQIHSINLATGALSASLGTIGSSPLIGVTRFTPQTNVYGITTENKLVRISLTDPSMVTTIFDPMLMPQVDTITNLMAGEHLVGIDVRPGSNVMYGVGSLGSVYSVNSSTAGANRQGAMVADPTDSSSPFTALSGTSFGVDFDPTTPVPMRVVSNSEQNLRLPYISLSMAPTRAITDTALNGPGSVDVTAAAYTNSFIFPAGVTPTTTLYVIDVLGGQLMTQASNGSLTAVGPLNAGTLWDPAAPTASGFDIAAGNNGIALAAFQRPLETFSRLYRIDLTTGAATAIGAIGGAPLRGLAVQIR